MTHHDPEYERILQQAKQLSMKQQLLLIKALMGDGSISGNNIAGGQVIIQIVNQGDATFLEEILQAVADRIRREQTEKKEE